MSYNVTPKDGVFVVGIGLIIYLFIKGLVPVITWIEDLPWYYYIPVTIVLYYTIYRIGKNFNWW